MAKRTIGQVFQQIVYPFKVFASRSRRKAFLSFIGEDMWPNFLLFLGRQLLTSLIIPSHFFSFEKMNLAELAKQEKWSEKGWKVSDEFVGGRLHTIKFIKKENKKYILRFMGNGISHSTQLQDSFSIAECCECNVITFDYRGVGQSKGEPFSKTDLVNDGIAQVKALLDQGIAAEDIILHGYSLGGGVATLVAEHFHKKTENKIYLFNDRSFSRISDVVIGKIRLGFRANQQQESWWGKGLAWVLQPVIRKILQSNDLEIDAAKAYKALPEEYKLGITVRPKDKSKCADPVIGNYGSLYEGLKRLSTSDTYKTITQSIIKLEVRKDTIEKYYIIKEGKTDADVERDAHVLPLWCLSQRHSSKATAPKISDVNQSDDAFAVLENFCAMVNVN